ncbi:MAG: hypothetical protein QM784_39950 [Polyangiaceae bacterium]
MIWIVASLISTLGIALLVYRAFVENDGVRSKTAIGMFIVGAALALPSRLLIAYALDSFGWAMRVTPTVSPLVAWLSATLIAAPINIWFWSSWFGRSIECIVSSVLGRPSRLRLFPLPVSAP